MSNPQRVEISLAAYQAINALVKLINGSALHDHIEPIAQLHVAMEKIKSDRERTAKILEIYASISSRVETMTTLDKGIRDIIDMSKWSEQIPTVPGLYEFKCTETDDEAEMVKVHIGDHGLMVTSDGLNHILETFHNNLDKPMWRQYALN